MKFLISSYRKQNFRINYRFINKILFYRIQFNNKITRFLPLNKKIKFNNKVKNSFKINCLLTKNFRQVNFRYLVVMINKVRLTIDAAKIKWICIIFNKAITWFSCLMKKVCTPHWSCSKLLKNSRSVSTSLKTILCLIYRIWAADIWNY